MRGLSTAILACSLGLAAAAPMRAADDPPSKQSLGTPGCRQAAAPATKPAPASADGTSPGNSGSTGWSGGIGGSNIGTSQNGATPNSKSFQPVTAKGLDPIGAPVKAC